jgi:hypothetical protein
MRNAEVIRQWTLLKELEGSRTSTIDGLAERTGVSTRTIRRDLIALQEAGFPIYDETLDDGRKRWRLDAKPFRALADNGFTLSELSALYFSRTLVQQQAGLPFDEDLARAFEKIEAALSPAVRRFLDHLPEIVGAGPGTFAKTFAPIKPPEAEMARLVHNDYLEQACDSGWPAFSFFAAFVAAAVFFSHKAVSKSPYHLAAWLCLVGWSLQSFVEFGLYIPAISWSAFILFGLLLASRFDIDTPKPAQ